MVMIDVSVSQSGKIRVNLLIEGGEPSVDNILGSRIKYLRERRNHSQKQLAVELDITNVQLSRYETGSRKPDPETIARIARFFHVSADFLLGLASTVHDPKSVYITESEHAMLEQIKQNPELERVLQDLFKTSRQKKETFIKMWDLFQSKQD